MKNLLARLTMLAALATVAMLTGCATTEGGDHGIGPGAAPASDFDRRVVRMAIRVNEVSFSGPAYLNRYRHNWTDRANHNYRWTFAIATTGSGRLTGRLLAMDAAVIAEGMPLLWYNDVVDVYIVPREEMNFDAGIAPIILKRICSGKDEACIDALRKAQGGRIVGMVIEGQYPNPANTKLDAPLKDKSCTFLGFGCTGHL